jgi:hypothetical protein
MRHGESIHFVRPDRIVRTGVLSPIVGYQPQNDVMMVTQEFVSGPSSGMQLSGYGFGASHSGGVFGAFRRFGLRVKAMVAARKAQKMMLTNASQQASPAHVILAAGPTGPGLHIGHEFQAQTRAMGEMARFLAMRGVAPMTGDTLAQRRWNTYFYSG